MRIRARSPVAAVVAAALLGGCGKEQGASPVKVPVLGAKGADKQAPAPLGIPFTATKNTTRIPGSDPVADAAAVARAVYPSVTPEDRPQAVVLADVGDWRSALAASVLMAPPIRAPLLFSDGADLPATTREALDALAPSGSDAAGGAQVVRVGAVARPAGLKSADLAGRDADALARAIDSLQASARGASSGSVMVVSGDEPAFAMPAAALAAKSGVPILFARRDTLPAATRAAIAEHDRPRIYVLGPSEVISPKVTRALRPLGTVIRLGGQDPQSNAVALARYADRSFGWGIVDPGHGLVFADPRRPQDAAAAAPLSASGTYGPLLLTDQAGALPQVVRSFLLDIQPGYRSDPTRGVYNRGWIVGDQSAVGVPAQAEIDRLLEIRPARNRLPSQR